MAIWLVYCFDCGYSENIDDATTTVPTTCPSCGSSNITTTKLQEV